MSEELNNLLKLAYSYWKDEPNPPIPPDTIKKYLKLEGVELSDLDEDVSNVRGDKVG